MEVYSNTPQAPLWLTDQAQRQFCLSTPTYDSKGGRKYKRTLFNDDVSTRTIIHRRINSWLRQVNNKWIAEKAAVAYCTAVFRNSTGEIEGKTWKPQLTL
jgi:hypothetical protein